jgi:hypothetical protein
MSSETLKKRSASFAQRLSDSIFTTSRPKPLSGQLEHARQSQGGTTSSDVARVHDQRARLRNAVPAHQLVHVHLVHALEDGLGIVDDRHAQRFGRRTNS